MGCMLIGLGELRERYVNVCVCQMFTGSVCTWPSSTLVGHSSGCLTGVTPGGTCKVRGHLPVTCHSGPTGVGVE